MEDKKPKNVEDDFIATIKLITGEELISSVSYMPDDDSLVLEGPMVVSRVDSQQKDVRINGFALQEWIASTFDQMFVLPKAHVITMTEVEDKQIQDFYKECVHRHTTQVQMFKDTFEPKKFNRNMGRLGSTKETRKSLEDLFNKS